MSDSPEIAKTSDIRKSAREYIIKKYRWLLVVSGVMGLAAVLFYILFKDENFLGLLYVPVIILTILYIFEIGRLRKRMFEDFAKNHGYAFSAHKEKDFGDGSLFLGGKNKSVSEFISGVLENIPVEFFNFDFIVERTDSKGQRTKEHHNFFVIDMDLGTVTPSILLRYKGSNTVPKVYFGRADVRLEGQMGDIYDLEVEKEFEIEALQIFSPDIMQEILSVIERPEKPKLNVEFYGNHAIVFIEGEINNPDLLESVYNMSSDLAKHWAPLMVRIKGSVEALRAQFSGKQPS